MSSQSSLRQNHKIELVIRAASDLGRERSNNEDAFAVADALTGINEQDVEGNFEISERPMLLAVTDGMGGENAGEVASGLTLASLRRAIAKELPRGETADVLRAAIEYANAVVTGAARTPGREGMGATLVTAIVQGAEATIGCVGDSRIYILRNGHLSQLTKDQSFIQYLIDSKAIKSDEIASFPHKNIILQAVGRAENLNVPIARIALRRGDVLLLCTDGLTGEVADDKIRDILATNRIDAACKKLIEAANANGGHDNITVIVASIDGDGVPAAAADEICPQLVSVPSKKG
ncbi:MAG: protein phosphatase 2C domain-containing protein [Polyangiaceae bacterium]